MEITVKTQELFERIGLEECSYDMEEVYSDLITLEVNQREYELQDDSFDYDYGSISGTQSYPKYYEIYEVDIEHETLYLSEKSIETLSEWICEEYQQELSEDMDETTPY